MNLIKISKHLMIFFLIDRWSPNVNLHLLAILVIPTSMQQQTTRDFLPTTSTGSFV